MIISVGEVLWDCIDNQKFLDTGKLLLKNDLLYHETLPSLHLFLIYTALLLT